MTELVRKAGVTIRHLENRRSVELRFIGDAYARCSVRDSVEGAAKVLGAKTLTTEDGDLACELPFSSAKESFVELLAVSPILFLVGEH